MNTVYGPYSPVRTGGGMLFISGQIGIDPITRTADADIVAQTQQALNNMNSLLQAEGLSLENIVKTTVFLTSMDNFPKMNTIYEQNFTIPRPARSTVAVRELPRVAGDVELLVEIEAVAVTEIA